MSILNKEINDTKTEIKNSDIKQSQPQTLAEDLLDKVSGAGGEIYLKWSKSF
ncbi:XyeA family cyclophane-containing RiPP triceptide [Xenorhabdus thailandensis]|uniref:XyeA family cyclophane-containing RiPP triceptide n=1 Tax=Xenorhabdus thailandensis TaxID=3136255 RepID=UPI0030F4211F